MTASAFLVRSLIAGLAIGAANSAVAQSHAADADVQQLRIIVADLQRRVAELESQNATLRAPASVGNGGPQAAIQLASATMPMRVGSADTITQSAAENPPPAYGATPALAPPGGATLNYTVDGYYEYNWNKPAGRANDLTPRSWWAARGEYFDDHGGLFSRNTQVLKETTATYEHKLADNFATFLEFRRDWSNIPYFTTSQVGVLAGHQTTAALGMVWWCGGKRGSW